MMLTEFITMAQKRLEECGDLPVVVAPQMEVDWEEVPPECLATLQKYIKVRRPLHCLATIGVAESQVGVPDSMCIPIYEDTACLDQLT